MNLETTGFKLWIEVQVKKTTTAPPTTRQAMAPAESRLGADRSIRRNRATLCG